MKVHIPEFQPASLMRGGHAQTLGAFWFTGTKGSLHGQKVTVDLPDQDQVVLHDTIPTNWQPGNRIALMLHGLGGSHASPYMIRIARKLHQHGVRVFRMDMRGCGDSLGLCRNPVHSGRSDDVCVVIERLAELCPLSPVTLIGFSMGGNITLKLMGERGEQLPGNLDAAIAVCPPINLLQCVRQIQQPPNHLYDRYFVKLLLRSHLRTLSLLPDALTFDLSLRPKRLIDLDNMFTAPVCGFGDAFNYYKQCSSEQFLPAIKAPTLVLAADDDPMIPADSFYKVDCPPDLHIVVARGGGHLGFLGQLGADPDRRWMDWRILDWVKHNDEHAARRPGPRRKSATTQPSRLMHA